MDRNLNRDLNRLTNLKTVKQQLFNHPAISRADISRNTGLTRSTISSLFSELDAHGYIEHLGRGTSTGSGGRKPEMYTFNARYGYVACFNITYDSLYAMFLYVGGQEISFEKLTLKSHELLNVMEIINQRLSQLAQNDDTEHGLLGISFSIHAVVDQNKVVHSPYYPIHGIDLQQYFEDRYQVPVQIGNEANLAAIYERDYAQQQSPANFIVLGIHRGPGIGVIANRQLFSGFHGMVGELGSVKIPNRRGQLQEVGDYLSNDYLLEQLGQAAGTTIEQFNDAQEIVAAGAPAVQAVLDNFADITGHLLFNLQMLYGPEKVFINSPLIELLPLLQDKIAHQATAAGLTVPLTFIQGSKYVSLLGAGALMIRHVLELSGIELNFQWSRHIG